MGGWAPWATISFLVGLVFLFQLFIKILKIIREKSFLNVGTGKDYTIKQYAKLMGKHFDKKIKIIQNFSQLVFCV